MDHEHKTSPRVAPRRAPGASFKQRMAAYAVDEELSEDSDEEYVPRGPRAAAAKRSPRRGASHASRSGAGPCAGLSKQNKPFVVQLFDESGAVAIANIFKYKLRRFVGGRPPHDTSSRVNAHSAFLDALGFAQGYSVTELGKTSYYVTTSLEPASKDVKRPYHSAPQPLSAARTPFELRREDGQPMLLYCLDHADTFLGVPQGQVTRFIVDAAVALPHVAERVRLDPGHDDHVFRPSDMPPTTTNRSTTRFRITVDAGGDIIVKQLATGSPQQSAARASSPFEEEELGEEIRSRAPRRFVEPLQLTPPALPKQHGRHPEHERRALSGAGVAANSNSNKRKHESSAAPPQQQHHPRGDESGDESDAGSSVLAEPDDALPPLWSVPEKANFAYDSDFETCPSTARYMVKRPKPAPTPSHASAVVAALSVPPSPALAAQASPALSAVVPSASAVEAHSAAGAVGAATAAAAAGVAVAPASRLVLPARQQSLLSSPGSAASSVVVAGGVGGGGGSGLHSAPVSAAASAMEEHVAPLVSASAAAQWPHDEVVEEEEDSLDHLSQPAFMDN